MCYGFLQNSFNSLVIYTHITLNYTDKFVENDSFIANRTSNNHNIIEGNIYTIEGFDVDPDPIEFVNVDMVICLSCESKDKTIKFSMNKFTNFVESGMFSRIDEES